MKLPLKCTAEYIKDFLPKNQSKQLYQDLIEVYKIQDLKLKMTMDKQVKSTDFSKLMFIDKDLHRSNKFPEEFWGKSEIWSPKLMKIKKKIEAIANKKFPVCVCIYYPDGNSGVDYHSDYSAFGDTNLIFSLSLGEKRAFHLREKESSEVYEIDLEEGSLIVMGDNCQQLYEHSLPVNPKYLKGRINLTFRQYGF